MTLSIALFVVPTFLYLAAFLYETYLSFKRIKNPKKSRSGYVSATWEITHTLLVLAVVMLFMLFTQSINMLSALLFVPAFTALLALTARAILYMYIFYGRKSDGGVILDWAFALSHLVVVASLGVTVWRALWFMVVHRPLANTQFLPVLVPGLFGILIVCIVPAVVLYSPVKPGS